MLVSSLFLMLCLVAAVYSIGMEARWAILFKWKSTERKWRGFKAVADPLVDGWRILFARSSTSNLVTIQTDDSLSKLAKIQRLLRLDSRAFVAFLNVIATVLAVTMLPFAAGIGLGNNLDIPILFLLAGLFVGLFAEVVGGDSGNSSGRAAIQLRNLILLAVSVGAVAILSGSFGLDQIADRQSGTWNIVLQPLGFVIYAYSAFNFVTRLACPVLESDPQTEHRSSLFCRHLRGIIVAYLASLIFLGGWNPLPAEGGLGRSLLSCLILHLKVLLIYIALMWMRFERDRIATSSVWQSLNKSVISVVIFNCVMTTVVMLLGDTNKWLILAGTQWTTLVALVAVAFIRQTASAKQ